MSFGLVFHDFLSRVGMGIAAVLALFVVVQVGIRKRSVAAVERRRRT